VASCFFLNGLSYTAVIAGLLMMRLPTFQRPVVRTSFWEHTADGFSYVWNHRRLRIILLLFAVVGVFGWSYAVLLPAFAIDLLKVEQEGYGVMLSANGLGALAGALTVATVGARINRRLLVFGGLAVFSGMLVLLSIAQSYWLVLACLTGAGWGMLLFFATTNTLLQTTASDEMRGRVMGIWALVFGGITPLGGLLAGALSQSLGLRLTVAMGALICATTGLLVWLRVVRRKEQVLRNAN
jgi:predicted MFS family arabinose efflux permease